jgi:hypothetical protein
MNGAEQDAPPVGEEIHLPGPTLIPLLSAVGITLIVIGTTINWIFSIIGGVIFIGTTVVWIRDTRRDVLNLPEEHGAVAAPAERQAAARPAEETMPGIGAAVATLGAIVTFVAVFLQAVATPKVGGHAVRIPNNSLLQIKDGWILIVLLVLGVLFLWRAYASKANGPLWGIALAGLAILGVAIYDAASLNVHYIAYGTGLRGTVSASAAVGIYLAGAGGLLMMLGAAFARLRPA